MKWACKSGEDMMVTWQYVLQMSLPEFSQPNFKDVLLVAVLAWQHF